MSRHPFLALILPAFLAVVALAKTDNWIEVRASHFTVVSNSNEKQSRRVADQFERMRAVFHKRFPDANVEAASPIVVIAVKDKKDFQALEPEAYLAKGQLNLDGLFLQAPDKNYVLLRLDAEGDHPYATVYHEYTHFLMRRAADWIPLWLNEGLAEFYENTEIKEKEVALGEPSIENIQLLRENHLLPLATLLTVDQNSPYYHEENKGSIFYAESWALTHYLQINDRKENTDRLADYLKLLAAKVDPVTAATRAFGDLKQLEKNLGSYVAQGSFMYFRMPGAIDVDNTTVTVRALTAGQADAVRADFLAYNERWKDSRALLDRVLHDDPNNVSAHETMGLLAFRENNLDEAGKWYEQAVKLDSQSYLAHYYFAVIAMREGMSSPERQAQIEASLRAANKLNTSFAPAFDELAVFYGMQRKNLDEAHKLSLIAVQLDPGNVGFRLSAANILVEMERPQDAIQVLQATIKLTTNPEQVASIQRHIESVQQYQTARERAEQYRQENAAQEQAIVSNSEEVLPPEDDRHGPRHSAKGTLHHVECSSPAIIRLKVDGGAKPVALHARNYYKIPFTALNFTPTGEINPCKDLEGMKAKVEFFEGATDTAEGQIISIELTK